MCFSLSVHFSDLNIVCLVAAIDIYMADIQQILGDEDATTWLIEWIEEKQYSMSDSVKTLDECELDALRFQIGGESATCGLCSNTIYQNLTSTKCADQKFDSIDILWNNTDCE
jgi:hypothetical protein